MRSGKICEHLFRWNRKGLRQLYDVFQSHVPLSALHTANVVTMQARPFGQFLLGVAPFVTQPSQRGAEPGLDRAYGHSSIFES